MQHALGGIHAKQEQEALRNTSLTPEAVISTSKLTLQSFPGKWGNLCFHKMHPRVQSGAPSRHSDIQAQTNKSQTDRFNNEILTDSVPHPKWTSDQKRQLESSLGPHGSPKKDREEKLHTVSKVPVITWLVQFSIIDMDKSHLHWWTAALCVYSTDQLQEWSKPSLHTHITLTGHSKCLHLPAHGCAGGFFLLKLSFSFPLSPIALGFSLYSLQYKVNAVMFCYINKTEVK